jgi:hypothetical protein
MKVKAAQFNAISCPDNGTAPNLPQIAVAPEKAPISTRICPPAGAPSFSNAQILARSILKDGGEGESFVEGRFDSTHTNVIASTSIM